MANIASHFLTQNASLRLEVLARQRREREEKQERRAQVGREKRASPPSGMPPRQRRQFLQEQAAAGKQASAEKEAARSKFRIPLSLDCAARAGQLDFVEKFIAAGADVNKKNINGDTPIMIAARNDHPDTDHDIVSALIKAGARLDIKNIYGATARDYAARNPELVKIIDAALSAGNNPSTEASSVTKPVQSKPAPFKP